MKDINTVLALLLSFNHVLVLLQLLRCELIERVGGKRASLLLILNDESLMSGRAEIDVVTWFDLFLINRREIQITLISKTYTVWWPLTGPGMVSTTMSASKWDFGPDVIMSPRCCSFICTDILKIEDISGSIYTYIYISPLSLMCTYTC